MDKKTNDKIKNDIKSLIYKYVEGVYHMEFLGEDEDLDLCTNDIFEYFKNNSKKILKINDKDKIKNTIITNSQGFYYEISEDDLEIIVESLIKEFYK